MRDFLGIARLYASRPDDWPLAPRFDPTGRWYHRLHVDDRHEAWLLTWLPGQGTDLHDHGGRAGAFVIVSGALTEVVAMETGNGIQLVRNEFADGKGHNFGPHHVHRVTNTSDRPAVSLHIYGPHPRPIADRVGAPALQQLGPHRATDLAGGFAAWRAAGPPVVPSLNTPGGTQ